MIFPGGGQKIKTAADIAQERSAKLKGPRQLDSGGTTVTGTLTQFRPPPGFLDATLRGEKVPDQLDTSDTGAMLSQLKAEAGAWPDLAKIISALNRTGLDGVAIEEATGIGRVQQNRWATAASVYESLRQAGDVPEETLEYFTQDGGDALVYELRFLAVENRSDPACYIANNQLDEHMALVLARSIKEHARRGGDMLGFSIHSGDCLAFKYYRDALECKKERDIEDCIQKGLDCAHSTSAKLKLRGVLDAPMEKAAEEKAVGGATLEMVRFTREELSIRPVALVGTYGEVTAEQMSGAPCVTTTGPFSSFRLETPSSTEWVALPAWNIILLAQAPVALFVPDCSQLPEVIRAANAKTDKEIARLAGPGLLVCDCSEEKSRDDKYYLTSSEGGPLHLSPSNQIEQGASRIGRLLFCCRPPAMQLGASADTSALLQL